MHDFMWQKVLPLVHSLQFVGRCRNVLVFAAERRNVLLFAAKIRDVLVFAVRR